MVNLGKTTLCCLLGIGLWNFPHSDAISNQAWQLFSLFLPTIVAVILKAMPIGAVCLFALSVALFSQTLTLEQGLSGFSNPVIWLITLAFFIARGFIKTGLGSRIAYWFIYLFGKRSVTLAYGLVCGDLILAPSIPSNTARAGGIMFPIVRSLAAVFNSSKETNTENRIGAFLMLCMFHGNVVTSAMFLTSMAANPLIAHFAAQKGVEITWMGWALAAIVPGLVALFVTVLLIYKLAEPEIKETPGARDFSKQELQKMGSLSRSEISLIFVFIFLLTGWINPALFGGASATVIAMVGLAMLLVSGVLSWDDIKKEQGAWDTLVWFAVLVTFAGFLDKFGFIGFLGHTLGGVTEGVSWQLGALFLIVSYFFIHYFFASSTAQVSALYPAFLGLGVGMGVPVLPFALILGFASNLYGGLTHYSIGHAPIFFGAGFVDIGKWWKIGFIVGVTNLSIFVVLGYLWMSFLGY